MYRRRLGRDDTPELEQPGRQRAEIVDQLRAAGADRDEELVRAAQALLAQIDPDVRALASTTSRSARKGIVVGDQATVTMIFEDDVSRDTHLEKDARRAHEDDEARRQATREEQVRRAAEREWLTRRGSPPACALRR